MNINRNDEIAKVAYNLYIKSGLMVGRELDNWLEAEKIVKALYPDLEMFQGSKWVKGTIGSAGQIGHTAEKENLEGLKPAGKKR